MGGDEECPSPLSPMLPFEDAIALFQAELGPATHCRSKGRGRPLSESRKLAAIFAADVVGFSRLAGADEDRILARLRALRSDLIDPTIAVHHGRGYGDSLLNPSFGRGRMALPASHRPSVGL